MGDPLHLRQVAGDYEQSGRVKADLCHPATVAERQKSAKWPASRVQ